MPMARKKETLFNSHSLELDSSKKNYLHNNVQFENRVVVD